MNIVTKFNIGDYIRKSQWDAEVFQISKIQITQPCGATHIAYFGLIPSSNKETWMMEEEAERLILEPPPTSDVP